MKLNQVVAVEKGVKARMHSRISALHNLIQRKELFGGGVRTYIPRDDDGETLPRETQNVQQRAEGLLDAAANIMSELINITLQKDESNAHAVADIIIDGTILVERVPAVTLIYLEKQLTDLHTFVSHLPVLDPSEIWQQDVNDGLYKTAPRRVNRTAKVQVPITLAEATDRHPAQTQLITKDVVIGEYETVIHAGSIPQRMQDKLLGRIDKLVIAVKQAREEANGVEAADRRDIAAQIFDYLDMGD
jgi:hypothetical protein